MVGLEEVHGWPTMAASPAVGGAGLVVAAVHLGIGAGLLDHEHVDAQAQDGQQRRRVELLEGPLDDDQRNHALTVSSTRSISGGSGATAGASGSTGGSVGGLTTM